MVRPLVAPYAGAWIETMSAMPDSARLCVAPYAGAWIETSMSVLAICNCGRRPLRGGVDRNDPERLDRDLKV